MRAKRLKSSMKKTAADRLAEAADHAIWAKNEEQGKALRNDDTLSKEDRRSKMGRESMKSGHDQIRALLTPDQQKDFDSMPPPEMHGRRGTQGRRRQPAADAPPKE